MHSHYHTTSKLSRKIGPRNAVLKGLLESLILYEKIETTEAKAKAIKPLFDSLVTSAKKNTLASTRSIHRKIGRLAAEKLTQELVHGLQDRNSGYTRTHHIGWRKGDAAELMRIEVILDENFEAKLKTIQDAAKDEAKTVAKPAKKATAPKKAKETVK